jgi:hypothetical protein
LRLLVVQGLQLTKHVHVAVAVAVKDHDDDHDHDHVNHYANDR